MEGNLTLGEFLRQERERRGITIEQLASATKIGIRQLHALEADHFAELPAKPFIRGFVTSYSRFIGLDPKEILTRFNDFIEKKSQDRPLREAGHSGYAFERKDGDQQSKAVLKVVLSVFLVFGGLVFVILKPSLHSHHSGHAEKLRAAHGHAPEPVAAASPAAPPLVAASPAAPQPVAEASPEKAPEKSSAQDSEEKSAAVEVQAKDQTQALVAQAQAQPKPQPSPLATQKTAEAEAAQDPLDSGKGLAPKEIHHKLILKALADVWVRYQLDERKMHKFILKNGKTLVLRAKEKVRFQVSNPKAITVNYNSTGTKPLSENKNLTTRQDNATLLFPAKAFEKIDKLFDDTRALPHTSDPAPQATPAVSTPTP